MIFWILVGILVVGTVLLALIDGLAATAFAFTALIVGGLIFLGCATWMPHSADEVSRTQSSLRALGAKSGLEGHSYFLGGGYINDTRVLNYITQDSDKGIHVLKADADRSTIYEDSTGAPNVIVKHYDQNNGWVATWPLGSFDNYDFHVPAGSVLENYTINNQ